MKCIIYFLLISFLFLNGCKTDSGVSVQTSQTNTQQPISNSNNNQLNATKTSQAIIRQTYDPSEIYQFTYTTFYNPNYSNYIQSAALSSISNLANSDRLSPIAIVRGVLLFSFLISRLILP